MPEPVAVSPSSEPIQSVSTPEPSQVASPASTPSQPEGSPPSSTPSASDFIPLREAVRSLGYNLGDVADDNAAMTIKTLIAPDRLALAAKDAVPIKPDPQNFDRVTRAHRDWLLPLALCAKEAATLLGISRAQFWKLHSSGRLPLPVRLGTKKPVWIRSELEDWLRAGAPDRATWLRLKQT
jgi:predicted DNA-binding transcriptional regulator AlpA